jgi:hypothetical protein
LQGCRPVKIPDQRHIRHYIAASRSHHTKLMLASHPLHVLSHYAQYIHYPSQSISDKARVPRPGREKRRSSFEKSEGNTYGTNYEGSLYSHVTCDIDEPLIPYT